MKKCKRWIAVLLVVVLCLPLCGCQRLDEMRAAHAVWQEDGSIKWDGNVYRKLADSPKISIICDPTIILLTEEDVPVLLSETIGEYCRISRNRVIFIVPGPEGEVLYCREDMYDFMTEHLKNPELTTYYYTYWNYETDGVLGEQHYYYLSVTQGSTIDQLITALEFVAVDEDFYYDFEANDFRVTLGKCDSERLFGANYVLEIVRKSGTFYLMTPDEHIAQVPADYDNIMKTIVSVYYNEEIRPFI